MRLLPTLAVVAFVGLMAVDALPGCPSICTCKWKNGKRWVECRHAGQISLPDHVDPETQVLDLSGNNLQILPREVFARHGLVNLQRLHLAHCNIGQIDPAAFRGLTNLVELNLAGNLLTAVPTATFADIPYLRELRLSGNPLQKVESDAFEMVPQLVTLDLSECGLRRLAAKAFAHLAQLQKLDLARNKLTEIRHKTVESIAGVHSIELGGNPWVCDCQLRPLKVWLLAENVPSTAEATCAAPNRIRDKTFSELDVDQFACTPEVVVTNRVIEAKAGQNASILCKVSSVPSASVRWFSGSSGLSSDGGQIVNNTGRFVVTETGGFEKTSVLVVTSAREEDSGQFACVAENSAGRAEANFSLQVGYFVGGVASLESSEIAGIAISFSFVSVLAVIIVLAVVLRGRVGGGAGHSGFCGLGTKESNNNADRNKIEANARSGTASDCHHGMGLTDLSPSNVVKAEVLSNGALNINGTVYRGGPDLLSQSFSASEADDNSANERKAAMASVTPITSPREVLDNIYGVRRSSASAASPVDHGFAAQHLWPASTRTLAYYSPQMGVRPRDHRYANLGPLATLPKRPAATPPPQQQPFAFPSDFGLPRPARHHPMADLPEEMELPMPTLGAPQSPLRPMARRASPGRAPSGRPPPTARPNPLADTLFPAVPEYLMASEAPMPRVWPKHALMSSPSANSSSSSSSSCGSASRTTARTSGQSAPTVVTRNSCRESPDEGIQDDCSTDV